MRLYPVLKVDHFIQKFGSIRCALSARFRAIKNYSQHEMLGCGFE